MSLLLLFSCGSGQPEARGVQTNPFIPAEKLAAVRVCETTVQQLLSDLGAPSGQGRDGDFATYSWTAIAMVVEPGQMAMGSQGVYAWVDGNGRVASFLVNPIGMPQTPQPCDGEIWGGLPVPDASPPPMKKKPDDA
ncbi:MAG: hypothetical protein EOO73_11975 [Myxococcales bacterium]|nr:MAG: hypothetical protein EOO73_11975 [Myxococcales bacterium]